MTYQNRTIIVERNSRELTTRVIQALDGYDDVAQAAADAEAAASEATTAATNAESAAVDAVAAADAAAASAKFFFSDKASMLASNEAFAVGDQLLTREDRGTYTVVDADPDETTSGGVMLQRTKGGFFLGNTPYFRDEGEENDGTLRIPQRAFIGEHWNFYGALDEAYNAANGSGYTWIGELKGASGPDEYLIDRARLAVSTSIGLAISGLSRAEDSGRQALGVTGVAAIKGGAVAVGRKAWGLYAEMSIEATPTPGQQDRGHGAEIACSNFVQDFGVVYPSTDFGDPSLTGLATGITVNCGAGPGSPTTQFPIQWGLRIESVNSGARFHTGILVRDDALLLGADGRYSAMMMARLQKLHWFDASDNEVFSITAAGNAAADKTSIEATTTGISFRNENNTAVFFIGKGTGLTTPSFLRVDAVSGTNPRIEAQGPAADIDVQINPKGTGRLRLGYAVPVATTPANFSADRVVEMKDGSGNVVYVPAMLAAW